MSAGLVVLAINVSKVDNARSLSLTANVVVEKMGTLLQLAIRHDGGVDDRQIVTKHPRSIAAIHNSQRNAKTTECRAVVDNLLDCSLGGLALATTGGTFDSILILTMPIDRSAIVQVQDAGTRCNMAWLGWLVVGVRMSCVRSLDLRKMNPLWRV